MARSPLITHLIAFQQTLINTDYVRELFMIPDRLTTDIRHPNGAFSVTLRGSLYVGKLFVFDKQFYAIKTWTRTDDRSSNQKTYLVEAVETYIVYDKDENLPLCKPTDRFTLEPGDIINGPKTSIETTVGVFIANYLFLVFPFGATIDYLNEEFTDRKLEKRISYQYLKGNVTTEQVKDKYVNTLSLFGQSNEMICPNISEKTISIPPHINALREKLVSDNREALDAGDTTVMSDIEQQLINAYKDHLKDDPAMDFLIKSKYFNVVLKKLFLVQGMTEIFGQPGKFTFIEQPMGSGWKIKDLPAIFDEVRQGSYARAIETADGGVIAKLILRVLQDTRITIPDCKTKIGETILGTSDQLKDLLHNYVINTDGSTGIIDDDTFNQYIGKTIMVRTPGFCKAPDGFCAKCFGSVFEELGQQAFAPIANDVGRAQLVNSLKAMHGRSHSVTDISDINMFVI